MRPEVDLTLPLPGLSPVCGKPVVARFDAGQLSSDGGILLLAEVERRLGIAERPARCNGRSGKTIVRINPAFYRSAEVDIAGRQSEKGVGDFRVAAQNRVAELVTLMVEADDKRVRDNFKTGV